MLMHLLEEIGITGSVLKINSRGVMADRGPAGELLKNYFAGHVAEMCPD
jgi:histidyl-tRNA synthetase